jgi:leader peptidase (prepilin peptidase)/N-methyltransferase
MNLVMINLVLGWIGAVLVNYLADVLPVHRNLVRATCPDCGSTLSWRYYFFFRPCQSCGTKPGLRHKIVLVMIPVLAALSAFYPAENLGVFGSLVWLLYFGLVIVIDLEYRLILHPVSIAGAALGMAYGILNHGIWNTLIGGSAGFGIMLAFYLFGILFVRILAKTRGNEIDEVALGFGDVNLAGVIGLLLGWPGIVGGIFLAILLGGLVSGIVVVVNMIQKKYQAFQALPYGPFLAISAAALLFISSIIK